MGAVSTGTPPNFNRYNEMATGMMQMAVDTFAGTLGYRLGDQTFHGGLARKHTLIADRDEIIQDATAAIYTRVQSVLPRGTLEHRFTYRLLPSCNLLIGIDPREFDCEPDGNDSPWETASDF